MARKRFPWVMFGVAVLLIWPALVFGAAYICGEDLELAPLLTTVDSPANHVIPVSNPGFYAGVAKVIVGFGNTWYGGSGALLRQGGNLFLITAGHLIFYNNSMATTLYAYFPGLSTSYVGTAFYPHPLWTGDLRKGYDVALVRLNAPVPVQGYEILPQEISATAQGMIAGYGISGQGKQDPGRYPFGTLREGKNTFGEAFWSFPGSPYAFDFDNGKYLQNVLRSYYKVQSDYGLGKAEVMIAPGDSGGPTFINGYLAGIHSFGATLGRPYDVDWSLNSSYGELAGDTRLAEVAFWVEQVIGLTSTDAPMRPLEEPIVTPLPSSLIILLTGLVLMLWFQRRHARARCS